MVSGGQAAAAVGIVGNQWAVNGQSMGNAATSLGIAAAATSFWYSCCYHRQSGV